MGGLCIEEEGASCFRRCCCTVCQASGKGAFDSGVLIGRAGAPAFHVGAGREIPWLFLPPEMADGICEGDSFEAGLTNIIIAAVMLNCRYYKYKKK